VPLRHGEGDKVHLTRLAALSLGAYAVGKKDLGAGTMGLVTIALVVPACARDCDSGCSGPWRHLTT
jgi:hypothetical protein